MQDRFSSQEVDRSNRRNRSPTSVVGRARRGQAAAGGHRRLYSMQNLTDMAVICELRRKGFSLQGVRKVMRFLQREFGKGLAEIVGRNSDVHLLTDGTRLYLETSAETDRRHPEEFKSAHSGCLPQRRSSASAGRCGREEGQYFRNSVGRASSC